MSKMLALLFGITMLCGAFTACGDKDSSSEANKETDGMENVTDMTDDDHEDDLHTDDDSDSRNGMEKIITKAGDAVDDAVDEGRELVTDIADELTTNDKND